MSIEKDSYLGTINVSKDAIASLAGAAVAECYGVVGIAPRNMISGGLAVVLGQDNYSKGVAVKKGKNGLVIDLYIIVSYGVKISAVVHELQQRVKYTLEKSLDQKFEAVNVFVQGVRVID
ncbi:MAG: Asp23/Gls24 family envelope stress response protein [Erysipelotrichales bacterium]|nr:Asp23/Gls24 family envelope stress response protein [Erysipelotrichales bacterium]